MPKKLDHSISEPNNSDLDNFFIYKTMFHDFMKNDFYDMIFTRFDFMRLGLITYYDFQTFDPNSSSISWYRSISYAEDDTVECRPGLEWSVFPAYGGWTHRSITAFMV